MNFFGGGGALRRMAVGFDFSGNGKDDAVALEVVIPETIALDTVVLDAADGGETGEYGGGEGPVPRGG